VTRDELISRTRQLVEEELIAFVARVVAS